MADPAATDPAPQPAVSLDQIAQAIASGVGAAVTAAMAGVTTSLNEITNKVNALETRIKQTSVNEDVSFEANVTGAYDTYDDARRTSIINHRLSASMAENADAMMKEYLKYTAGVWARSLDHYCSMNPEVPPKANKA